jgi:hypothetical protein
MATQSELKAAPLHLPLATVEEINRLLVQAIAITWLISDGANGTAPDEAIPNACWAVVGLIENAKKLANQRIGDAITEVPQNDQ